MARKKTKTQQAKIAARRLVEDEEVQKHLRLASVRAREAWSRLTRRSRLPKHIGRKVVAGAAVVGGAAYAVKRKRSNGNEPGYDGQTMAAAPVPFPDSPVPVA